MATFYSELSVTGKCSYTPEKDRGYLLLLPTRTLSRKAFARAAAIANDNGLFSDNARQQVQSLRCEFCKACVPIRINISKAELSRSDRRTDKKGNALFTSSGIIGSPTNNRKFKATIQEYGDLMSDYLLRRHVTISSRQESAQRIKKSTHALEVRIQNDGALIGLALMSIADGRIMLDKIYYDIDESQHVSLGRYVLLKVIESARENGLSFIYPAPWVKDSYTMDYKKTFPGLETYVEDDWVDFNADKHDQGLSDKQSKISEYLTISEIESLSLDAEA